MGGNYHAKFHSPNAFCGSAGPEEMRHLHDLIDELSDKELELLVENVGIKFSSGKNKGRGVYESVIDEASREDFYREYRQILELRKPPLKK